MYDSYNREITYLRISVTDKCNLRCRYCIPEEGVPARRHEEFLSFEEITEVVRAAVKLGVTKVRLTGGEPLVKRGIVDLVLMIRSIEGLEHLAMTTNGTLLTLYSGRLKAAISSTTAIASTAVTFRLLIRGMTFFCSLKMSRSGRRRS